MGDNVSYFVKTTSVHPDLEPGDFTNLFPFSVFRRYAGKPFQTLTVNNMRNPPKIQFIKENI